MAHAEVIDMPDFIQRLIGQEAHISALPISDRWVDVGRRETYQRLLDYLDEKSGEGEA